ncbi:ATP-binding protein [Peribacillus asahii]|uniref:ATP-binding protein n=1 Tax=Peribacillus asahii TaxID=228899 RepID=A0A398B9L6_9BACI|nr:ATP-binding protein [Peribacillus asahii]RID86675.1 ATP-binding protein [Peribacillus asahii]
MTKVNHQSIIQFSKTSIELAPQYYNYAFAIHNIQKKLTEETEKEFQLFSDGETSNEIWEVLEEDLIIHPDRVQSLATVYDCVETGVISSNHNDKQMEFLVKASINNHLYYYPDYQIALVRMPIYQAHDNMEHDYVFAENEQVLGNFLTYVLKRKREYIKDYVTVFIDTEDGVENEKEKITNLVTREDVFLEESMKKQIYRSIDEFFTNSGEFFKTYQIPYKRGILLYGKPGNGKTTLVKSIANSISAPVAYWQITEYTTSYSIKEVFSSVAKMSPMVLVIEDIDSMPEEVRSVFLNTLDGATSKEGIFLIGTTNYPEKIDPALINRSGRFDRAYEIKGPTQEMRYQYLLKKNITNLISKEDLTLIANSTDGFSFAQLNEVYNAVALQWHYEQQVDVLDICNELKVDNRKSKELSWDSDSETKVGFNF